MGSQTVVTAFAHDEELKGEPTPDFEMVEGEGQNLSTNTIEEPWNEYLLIGRDTPRLLRVKSVLTGLEYFPDGYNEYGDPIFNANSQVVVGEAIEAEGYVPK